MTSPRRVANPIAVRRYSVAEEPGREVVLTIGKPRPDPRPGGDWMCSVLVSGIPKERRRRIHGIDAVQALQMALVYARYELDASGLSLTWLDSEPGDVDLPLPVPTCWGFDFQQRMERYMNREVERMNAAATAIMKAKERRRRRDAAPDAPLKGPLSKPAREKSAQVPATRSPLFHDPHLERSELNAKAQRRKDAKKKEEK